MICGGTACKPWIHGLSNITLYADGASTTRNKTWWLSPSRSTGIVISLMFFCCSSLNPTRVVTLFATSCLISLIVVNVLIKRILVELLLSTNIHCTQNLKISKDITSTSWWGWNKFNVSLLVKCTRSCPCPDWGIWFDARQWCLVAARLIPLTFDPPVM